MYVDGQIRYISGTDIPDSDYIVDGSVAQYRLRVIVEDSGNAPGYGIPLFDELGTQEDLMPFADMTDAIRLTAAQAYVTP